MTAEDLNQTKNEANSIDLQLNGTLDKARRGPVGYACSTRLIMTANKLPSNLGRAVLVHTLLNAYQLFKQPGKQQDPRAEVKEELPQCSIIPVAPLSDAQLTAYHDAEFVSFIMSLDEPSNDDDEIASSSEDEETPVRKRAKYSNEVRHTIPQIMKKNAVPKGKVKTRLFKKYQKYGLEYDCPYFEGISEYVRLVGGASVACAEFLIQEYNDQQIPIAINWQGGRHHAKKSKASGFCYVNDAVLCILRLRARFPKVMYLDLDLHHGDGVETAFTRSSKVAVVSIHRHDRGFFPASSYGNLEYQGGGGMTKPSDSHYGKVPGYGYTLNIPTKRGLSGASLVRIFDEIIDPFVANVFRPNCVVVTLGTDGLARDEHREWTLSHANYERVLRKYVRDKWSLPTVLLGGGGYHHADTARCLAYVTASMLGRTDEYDWEDIPDHAMLEAYKEDAYTFGVDEIAQCDDANVGEHLDGVIATFQTRFEKMKMYCT